MQKEKYVTIFLLLILACLFFLLNSFRIRESNYPIGVIKNNSIQSGNIISLDLNQFSTQTLAITENDLIKITGVKTHYFKFHGINASNKKIYFLVDDTSFYSLQLFGTEKLNLDNDQYYDVSIYLRSLSNKSALIQVSSINEKIGFADVIDEKIKTMTFDLEKINRIQTISIILILLILIAIILYLIKSFFLPWIKLKNKIEEQDPEDVLTYLIEEANNLMDENKKKEAKKVFSRINMLYNYMTKENKRKYAKKIKDVERYINS
ncbi:MAG: hypothetical protein ACOYT4_01485 [Nanoarchaeota archaeon]